MESGKQWRIFDVEIRVKRSKEPSPEITIEGLDLGTYDGSRVRKGLLKQR